MAVKIEQQHVRAAVLAAHGLNAETPTFRAAFAFFRRSGAVTERFGKGQRQHYDASAQSRLLACFELSQMGLSPGLVLGLIENESLGEAFSEAQRRIVYFDAGDDDVILVLRNIRFASARWGAGGKQDEPFIGWCRLGELHDKIGGWMSESAAGTPAAKNVIAANLSDRLRRYHAALVEVTEGGKLISADQLDAVPTARRTQKKQKARSKRKRRA
jgi:hypothetical protein